MDWVNCKTFLVAGAPHSGTSLIAGSLHHLGVFMGRNWLTNGTFEDVDFVKNTEKEIIESIMERNFQYQVWGFKYPPSWKYMWSTAHLMRNLHIIYAYRNTTTLLRKRPSANWVRHWQIMGFWSNFIETFRYPCYIVDYDEAILKPEEFLNGLCDFCKIGKENFSKALIFNNGGTGYNTNDL